MYEVINMGYLAYEYDDEKYFVIGEIRKEVGRDNNITYVFDVDREKVKELSKYGEDVNSPIIISGIDLDYGYVQRHGRMPFFISMRTPDRRREDIDEILERYGLEYYDQFEILLRNKGKSLDKWRVLRELPKV